MVNDPPRYRIEHRRAGLPPMVLAEAEAVVPAMVLAREHAARLRVAKETGAVAIVNRRHGYDVVVQDVGLAWSLHVSD